MSKFWTDICLIPLLSLLVVGVMMTAHFAIHGQVKSPDRSTQIFDPKKVRDFGSLEKSCIKLLTRIENKPRGAHATDSQQASNHHIRDLDHRLSCISYLGRHKGEHYAGGYRTVSGHPELRFNELTGSPSNNQPNHNIGNDRLNFPLRIWPQNLAWIKGPPESIKNG